MTKRESRVIEAFLNCVVHGDYTESYAITLLEDQARYGWVSDEAKDYFYEELEIRLAPPVVEPTPAEEPVEEPNEDSQDPVEEDNQNTEENTDQEPIEG